MQPYPRSPDLVWPGHLHGTGCLSARAMDTGFPTVVWRLCLGLGCGWARVSAAPRHSWPGCWGVCVFLVRAPLVPRHSRLGFAMWVCVLGLRFRLRPATPGWGVGASVCLCYRSACTPPLLAGVCSAGVCAGLGFRLRPATPGWGVGACVCLCARSACTPPLLAGLCGVGVCPWARVSAAPRHSWLGCWCVCVFVCALRLYPATPGWGVLCGCVCFGSGFGCAPPLLAGVLKPVRAFVTAPLVPRHSWLGCAVGVCVLGLGFQLRPATPGCGVGVCVCLCARSVCTSPLLAGVCGVDVCPWARVSAAPRHSWLGCLVVCVFVCALCLYHATRGSVVRCGCVCWSSGFGCTPPLLAGLLGCVCACVRAPLVPRHSWLGCAVWACVFGLGLWLLSASPCWGVGVCVFVCALRMYVCRHSWLGCAVWVCVLGLGSRLRPATPGWGVWVCVCLCAHSACTMPLVARLCGVGACAGARVSAAHRHSWLGCWGVCVLGARSACASPLLARVCGVGVCVWARVVAAFRHSWLGCWGVRICVRAPLVPRHSWLGCAVWVCVLGLEFSAAPRHSWLGCWSACVCMCACSACTPPLLAGVCGVGLCAWARVSCAPRHSWLGCWGVCVFVCALRLYHATRGLVVRCGCVCWGSGFGCTPPLLAGVLGCVCASCALRLCPATPAWGVRCGRVCLGSGCGCSPPPLAGVLGCVCLCARSACTLPLLAWVSGADVCAWARVSAAPRHSWLGCSGVCVFVCALRLYPATPGWGVWCGCVCLGSCSRCAPPLLAGVLGCVCACVGAPLVPHLSWLGCAVSVCVLGLGFWLRPATPGWSVGLGVCVCVLAQLVSRHSWLGCLVWVGMLELWFPLRPATPGWGVGVCLCVCVLAPLVPRHSWLGCAVCLCVLGLGFWLRPATSGWGVGVCVFVCDLRLYHATPGWGVWCGCVCLGSGFGCAPPLLTGVCGVWVWCCVAPVPLPWFVACCAPGFAAPSGRCRLTPVCVPWLWPVACLSGMPGGPALVRRALSGPVALRAPFGFPDAVVPFPTTGACAPGFTGWLRGAGGGRPRTGLIVPAAGPRRGWGAGLAPRRTRSGPRDGVVPGGSLRPGSWAACAAAVSVCGPGH